MQVQKDEHLAPPDDFAVALAEAAKAGPANAKMLQYVFEHYGKKIGDGECYAVAKEAMQHVGANPPSAATPCAPDPPREPNAVLQWNQQRSTHPRAQCPHAVCRAIRYEFGRLITNPAEVCPGDLFQFKWAKFTGVTADGNHYSMYAGDRARSGPGADVARGGPGPTRCRCCLFTERFSGASESSRPRLTHAASRAQCMRAMATTRLWCTKSGVHQPVSRTADHR
jgi:hypothetical protein